jgi:hypothetical protein
VGALVPHRSADGGPGVQPAAQGERSDDDLDTLRAVTMEANADEETERIEFRIGGAHATGTKVIRVSDENLPAIVHPLVIDGYTQPGAHPNTAVRGSNADLRVVLETEPEASDVPGHGPLGRPAPHVCGVCGRQVLADRRLADRELA